MDITNHRIHPERTVQTRSRELIRSFRERLDEHREEVARGVADDARDRIEVSRRGNTLAEVYERLEEADDVERADLAKLKRAFEAGALNSPERLEKAAARLLGS